MQHPSNWYRYLTSDVGCTNGRSIHSHLLATEDSKPPFATATFGAVVRFSATCSGRAGHNSQRDTRGSKRGWWWDESGCGVSVWDSKSPRSLNSAIRTTNTVSGAWQIRQSPGG